jgi:Amt family ammonium transporter
MIISSGLVMFMTPGLAMFYGGLVRHTNILSIIMHNFVCMGIVAIIWLLIGYSLSFGPDYLGFIGGLKYVLLQNMMLNDSNLISNIPTLLFCAFQLMFAIITPALITGAIAERMKFSSFFLFVIAWTIFVYSPICHWVWGGGWLQKLGALDFAGGTVIHVNAGIASLACVILLGKREGFGKIPFAPNNLPLTLLGAGILWFGWFGFNAGSSLGANALAVLAFINTHIAAGSAGIAWICAEWIHRGKPTTLGIASGILAGLVAITPAAGFVGPVSSLFIGLFAGIFCYIGIFLKNIFKYDDALDVVGIHGIGGLWGALATGIFASKAWNPAGADGVIFGNFNLLIAQIISIGVVIIYSFIITFVILLIIKFFIGLRVTKEDEMKGLDITQHYENAYKIES